jgi:hypothetical protein
MRADRFSGSNHRAQSAVDVDRGAGDVGACIGGKEQRHVRELLCLADAAERERDTLKGERDQLAAQVADATDPARLDARVKARQELESKARAILGAEADFSGHADRAVMETALRQDNAQADFAGETEDYIRGAFEIRARLAQANRTDGADRARVGAIIGQRQTAAPRRSPLMDAVRQLRQDQHEAATRPLGSGR